MSEFTNSRTVAKAEIALNRHEDKAITLRGTESDSGKVTKKGAVIIKRTGMVLREHLHMSACHALAISMDKQMKNDRAIAHYTARMAELKERGEEKAAKPRKPLTAEQATAKIAEMQAYLAKIAS